MYWGIFGTWLEAHQIINSDFVEQYCLNYLEFKKLDSKFIHVAGPISSSLNGPHIKCSLTYHLLEPSMVSIAGII